MMVKLLVQELLKEVLSGEKLKEVYGVDVKGFMIDALERWK